MNTSLDHITGLASHQLTDAELARVGGGEGEELAIVGGLAAAPVVFLEAVAVYLSWEICEAAHDALNALAVEAQTASNLNQTLDAIDEANGIPASRTAKPDDFADAWGPFNGYTI